MIKILFSFKLLAWLLFVLISVLFIFNSNIFKNELYSNENYNIDNKLLINKINNIHHISYKNKEERNIWADDIINSLKIYDGSKQVSLLIDSIEKFKNNESNNRLEIMLSIINVTSNSNFLYNKGVVND
jgi:hypothetical protein